MKNLLKKINVFGLALILVGGLIITAQSAFTSVQKTITGAYYAFDPNVSDWVPVNIALLNQEEPGGFTCDDPTEDEICTGFFDNPPLSPAQSPDSDESEGIYVPFVEN